MFMLPLFFVILLFVGCRFQRNEGYLSLSQTTSINGLFFICVFFRHIQNFAVYSSRADILALKFDSYWGQIVVVPFLFFSGYGISESIKNKPGYHKMIPAKKILRTWLMFAIYVLIWIAIKIPIGKFYKPKDILLALTAWYTIGNLNWYIFAILSFWLGTWICFSLFKKGPAPYFAMLLFTAIYVAAVRFGGNASKFYDTVIAFDIGLFVSYYKDYLKKIYDNTKLWALLTAVSSCLLIFFTIFGRASVLTMWIKSSLLCAIFILISMRMKIGNPVSFWIGKHLLGMYLMHNIAMILLSRIKYMKTHPYVFTLATIAFSAILAWLFVLLFDLLWKQISKLTLKVFHG